MTVPCIPPWIKNVNVTAPAAQSPYPRTVWVYRQKTVAGVTDNIGNVGYSGAEQGTGIEGETLLYSALAASIQLGSAGRATTNVGLPGNATSKAVWKIFIPISAAALYSIRDRDIILDDEGYRYEVSANQWTSAGYEISTIRLEA